HRPLATLFPYTTLFRSVRIESDVAIQRREHLLEAHRPPRRGAAGPIGRADDLPRPHAAAGEQRTANLRPVIAAGGVVDARRSAEDRKSTRLNSSHLVIS